MIYCSFGCAGGPLLDVPLPTVPPIGSVITFDCEDGRFKIVAVEYVVETKRSPPTMFANITVKKMRDAKQQAKKGAQPK